MKRLLVLSSFGVLMACAQINQYDPDKGTQRTVFAWQTVPTSPTVLSSRDVNVVTINLKNSCSSTVALLFRNNGSSPFSLFALNDPNPLAAGEILSLQLGGSYFQGGITWQATQAGCLWAEVIVKP